MYGDRVIDHFADNCTQIETLVTKHKDEIVKMPFMAGASGTTSLICETKWVLYPFIRRTWGLLNKLSV